MKSGMIAAESLFEEFYKDEPKADLDNLTENLKSSWLEEELQGKKLFAFYS